MPASMAALISPGVAAEAEAGPSPLALPPALLPEMLLPEGGPLPLALVLLLVVLLALFLEEDEDSIRYSKSVEPLRPAPPLSHSLAPAERRSPWDNPES